MFLFGPRQTGKSTLLQTLFPQAKFYDLLEADTFRELSAAPELIRQRLRPQDELVIIDEIQKLLPLLDEVHLLIERNKDLRFILTGSSARKLKRGGANLLAGRALSEDVTLQQKIVVSLERESRRTDEGIQVLPVETFLRRLWRGEIVSSGSLISWPQPPKMVSQEKRRRA